MQRRQIREALVALSVPERRVEERQGCPSVEEIIHIGIPGAVEAREERQTRVVVEEHEPSLMDRDDRHVVIAGPVDGSELLQSLPQSLAMAFFDAEYR